MSNTCCPKWAFAVAVSAVLGAAGVHAASVVVELDSVSYVSPLPGHSIDHSASSATWVYDTATGVLTGAGLLDINFLTTSATNVFEQQIVNPVFSTANAASASSYVCIEGDWGDTLATPSHVCGGWDFGPNSANESSIAYGPGTAFNRTIGGDDIELYFPYTISQYDNMPATWDGTTLVFSNTVPPPEFHYDITFTAVPIPAAVWLFGSALGLLGWMRRKAI